MILQNTIPSADTTTCFKRVPLIKMLRINLLWLCCFLLMTIAHASEDTINLPVKPERVPQLLTVEEKTPRSIEFYTRYQYYKNAKGKKIKHGIRETLINLDNHPESRAKYVRVQVAYYHGQEGNHHIQSFYTKGVIEEKRYFLNNDIITRRLYDKKGKDITLDVLVFAGNAIQKREVVLKAFAKAYGDEPEMTVKP